MAQTPSLSPSNESQLPSPWRIISATRRQLESLIWLSEELAKMRYSGVVERADVKKAVRLMKVATQTAATDPTMGRIDMDMIPTGRRTANWEMEEALKLSLKELFAEVSSSLWLTLELESIHGGILFGAQYVFMLHRDVEIEGQWAMWEVNYSKLWIFRFFIRKM